MDRMGEIQGGVVAIFDTRYEDQKFENVEDKVGERPPCRGPLSEAAPSDPMSPMSRRRSLDFWR